ERAVPSGAHSSQTCLGSRYFPADVRMIWPVAKRGRPRQRHVPDILSIPAEDMLANAKWRTISWRTGTNQPASEDRPAHLSNHHQGALGLRAGSPADERRTWSLPLRGTILARPASSCAYDDDRLRLPPASPARNSKARKKINEPPPQPTLP